MAVCAYGVAVQSAEALSEREIESIRWEEGVCCVCVCGVVAVQTAAER